VAAGGAGGSAVVVSLSLYLRLSHARKHRRWASSVSRISRVDYPSPAHVNPKLQLFIYLEVISPFAEGPSNARRRTAPEPRTEVAIQRVRSSAFPAAASAIHSKAKSFCGPIVGYEDAPSRLASLGSPLSANSMPFRKTSAFFNYANGGRSLLFVTLGLRGFCLSAPPIPPRVHRCELILLKPGRTSKVSRVIRVPRP
jgi:hypothetical protein